MKEMRNVGESINVKKIVQFYKEFFIYLYLIRTLYVWFLKIKKMRENINNLMIWKIWLNLNGHING